MKKTSGERQIYQAFKGYKRMNHRSLKLLNRMGLTVTVCGSGHFRVENKANGKVTFVPESPSDHRSGRNSAKSICRILE